MRHLLLNEGEELAKTFVGGAIAKGLMRKHLRAEKGQSVDQYLRKLGVINGIGGLNMMGSSIFTNGSDDITFVCTYDLRVVRLLNVDVKYHMSQVAKTMAWSGNAIVREAESDEEPPSEETEEEKKNFRDQMIAKYGQGAIDILDEAYGKDVTDNWTEDEWEYYIWLYSASDPEVDPPTDKPDISLGLSDKQVGKKWGEHMKDYPDMKDYNDYKARAQDVFDNPDKIVIDEENGEYYYIQGNDLLRVKKDGTFVSMYPGVESGRVKRAIGNGGTVWEK